MKLLISIIAVLLAIVRVPAQNFQDNSITLEGYIFSEDSVPAENAHLINYRDSKIATTDNKGFFRINVQWGDSLMINHLSLLPKIVYATDLLRGDNHIYVPYRTYILKAISSRNYEKDKKNVEESMKQTKKDIQKQIIVKPYQRTMDNPYDDDKQNPGITIPLIQIGTPEKKRIDIDE